MPSARPRIHMLTVAVVAAGIMGGLGGCLAGQFAPKVVVGLYALADDDPPATFSPAVWAARQGLVAGAWLGAVGWAVAWALPRLASLRLRLTTRRWIALVAVVAITLGVGIWLARLTAYCD